MTVRSKEKLPPRSKSEFDISRLQELESDEADGNPATPASTVPPPLPPKPKPKPKPKPRVKPKPSVAQPAPVIYTAKPIYINLATTQAQPGNGATTTSTTTTPTTPTTAAGAAAHGNTITTITASQAAGLSAMSEESSDRTPTNPTGGDVAQVTHLTATTPVEEGAACAGTRSKAVDISSTADGTVGAVIANVVSVSAGATSSSAPKGGLHVSDLSSGGGAMAGYPVPRSFSDISCHHSRAGSDVSSEASRASRTSRASRASAGANLEKFFNEMGMEKDILDPLLRRQQRQGSELDIYESVSSLDSHDARSICSALSRTEMRDLSSSDAESFSDRGQQQTSVVERNARIIKWLCSVKKAKHTQPGFQGSAS
nr:hypothetical protein BaRGS_029847 [Batillaria attramentaria]